MHSRYIVHKKGLSLPPDKSSMRQIVRNSPALYYLWCMFHINRLNAFFLSEYIQLPLHYKHKSQKEKTYNKQKHISHFTDIEGKDLDGSSIIDSLDIHLSYCSSVRIFFNFLFRFSIWFSTSSCILSGIGGRIPFIGGKLP